jgi:hypothetical protein
MWAYILPYILAYIQVYILVYILVEILVDILTYTVIAISAAKLAIIVVEMFMTKLHNKSKCHLPRLLPQLFLTYYRRNFAAKLAANKLIPCSIHIRNTPSKIEKSAFGVVDLSSSGSLLKPENEVQQLPKSSSSSSLTVHKCLYITKIRAWFASNISVCWSI